MLIHKKEIKNMKKLDIIEKILGKKRFKTWILERYKCFGDFDTQNPECTIFCCKQIMERCILQKKK